MSIKYIQVGQSGLSNTLLPSWIYIDTNDTLATVTTAGYLNGAAHEFSNTFSNRMMAVVVTKTAPGIGNPPVLYIFQLQNNAGVWSLVSPAVDVPIPFIVLGNIQAGASGVAGDFISFPGTALKGSFVFKAVANTGNTTVTLSNDAMGQASVINIPDPGNAIGQLLVGATATPFVSGNIPKASGTVGLMLDSGITAASISSLLALPSGDIFVGNGSNSTTAVALSGAGTLSNTGVLTLTQMPQLYQASVTFNTAQMVTAYDTPLQIVANPLASQMILVMQASVYTASTGHTAYATGTAPIIQYSSGGTNGAHGVGTIATAAGLVASDITAATSQVRNLFGFATGAQTGLSGLGLYFSNATGDYTAGTGTSITISVVYQLLTATV